MIGNMSGKDMSGVQFRGMEWGSSKEEVIESEDKDPINRKDKGKAEAIEFKDSLNGHHFLVSYHFINDKLAKGIYIYDDGSTDEEEIARVFEGLYDLLKDKYGKPTKEETVPDINQIHQGGGYGTASWEGNKISVTLSLMFQQGELSLEITYGHSSLNKKLLDNLGDETSGKL